MNALHPAVHWTRRVVKTGIHTALAPFAIRDFRSRAKRSDDPERALSLAYEFSYFGIRISPVQIRLEIAALLGVLAARTPEVILEIGTASGGSLFLFTRIAARDALLISVDLPGGKYGGGYPSWRAPLYKSFARPAQKIALLRADSHDRRTVERVSALLGGRPVDLLFIDGDHSYEGVKSDFEMYSPLVRSGGVIAFHDIVPGRESDVGGVPRFWKETKRRAGTTEIVANWGQGGYGIGYLTRGASDRIAQKTPHT